MKLLLRSCLVGLVALIAFQLEAQAPPTVTVTPFMQSGVSLSRYDPSVSPTLTEFVQDNPALAPLIPYAAILTNSSGKNIVEVTVRWLLLDASWAKAGKGYILRQDGLFLVRGPVVPPGSRLLITPSYNWSEGSPNLSSPVPMSAAHLKMVAERFENSFAGSIALDTVIFEDGSVIGPDLSQTVAYIKSRKQAAETISQATLQVLDSGGDPASLLTGFITFLAGTNRPAIIERTGPKSQSR